MAHTHHDHEAPGQDRAGGRRALQLVLLLTTAFMVVEVVGGLVTGSLALLADAGHMLSDNLSLALALFAIWLAGRPATPERTFGYKRAEILAALANGVTLVVVAAWILYEAFTRLENPPDVAGAGMLAVAVAGLAVNVVAVVLLHRPASGSLNVSAALRHVIADLLGSAGVIVAAVVILLTGWETIDPLVSAAIALLVGGSAWPVLRDSTRILLEAAPPGVDVAAVGRAMTELPGVREVHDLHVWTITSGFAALSAHVLVGADDDCHERRWALEAMLAERFGIEHTTLQLDHEHQGEELIQLEMGERREDG